jgi:hypothetical protein
MSFALKKAIKRQLLDTDWAGKVEEEAIGTLANVLEQRYGGVVESLSQLLRYCTTGTQHTAPPCMGGASSRAERRPGCLSPPAATPAAARARPARTLPGLQSYRPMARSRPPRCSRLRRPRAARSRWKSWSSRTPLTRPAWPTTLFSDGWAWTPKPSRCTQAQRCGGVAEVRQRAEVRRCGPQVRALPHRHVLAVLACSTRAAATAKRPWRARVEAQLSACQEPGTLPVRGLTRSCCTARCLPCPNLPRPSTSSTCSASCSSSSACSAAACSRATAWCCPAPAGRAQCRCGPRHTPHATHVLLRPRVPPPSLHARTRRPPLNPPGTHARSPSPSPSFFPSPPPHLPPLALPLAIPPLAHGAAVAQGRVRRDALRAGLHQPRRGRALPPRGRHGRAAAVA